jgi:hypothetical protein
MASDGERVKIKDSNRARLDRTTVTERNLSNEIESEIDRTTELHSPGDKTIRAQGSLDDRAVSMTITGEGQVRVITGWMKSDGNAETGIHIECEIDGEENKQEGRMMISLSPEMAEELSAVLAEHTKQ